MYRVPFKVKLVMSPGIGRCSLLLRQHRTVEPRVSCQNLLLSYKILHMALSSMGAFRLQILNMGFVCLVIGG